MKSTHVAAAALLGAIVVAGVGCARGGVDEIDSALLIPPPAPCHGLACARVACPAGTSTRIAGRVTDPAGRRGLYGVSVYVPAVEPPPVLHGARCEPCARRKRDVVVSTLTDVRGEFALDDVPVGSQVPLVVELGGFRRIARLDVTPCREHLLADDAVRLPASSIEGDIPRIAATTGAADALECLLRSVGLDEREFVAGGDPRGAIHLYRGKGGGGRTGTVIPNADALWNDVATLAQYDVVVLSCEGDEAIENKGGTASDARGAMALYADRGGHVFATHLHATWLRDSPYPRYREIASWGSPKDASDIYDVDTTFPKGAAFAAWLLDTGASSNLGTIRLDNVTSSLASANAPAHAWVRQTPARPRYMTFNTPIGGGRDDACGRFVFADLHAFGLGGSDFPVGCPSKDVLSPQQLALEFFLFDLFACVDDDALPPAPPR